MSEELDMAVESIDVGRWSRCEREALHGGGERARRVPVARVVAQAAFRGFMHGDTEPDFITGDLKMDAMTPRESDIARQARLMADAAAKALALNGWEPEAAGDSFGSRHAFIALKSDALDSPTPGIRSALVHVRMGRDIGSAWLSLGQHLAEFDPTDNPPTAGVLVHVPRVGLGREFAATLAERHAPWLIETWNVWRVRIGEVLDSYTAPLASPGPHCARCTVKCAVRP